MNPTLSIYLLNHNYGRYLPKAIDSILGQSDNDFEFIVIDDGSNDGSQQILKTYEEKHGVKVFYCENRGLISSVLLAFKLLSGDFVARLDADDWLHEDFVAKMRSCIRLNPNVGLIAPDYFEVNASGKVIKKVEWCHSTNRVKSIEGPAHGACSFLSRTAYQNFGGVNPDITCQDGFDIWVAIFPILVFVACLSHCSSIEDMEIV